MSTALEAASLIMVPSGYDNGVLGSVKPTDGTGDFTFTRGSNISATRVNEQGYIEKGYENLLEQSNQFDTSWGSQGTLTSGQSGYDATTDAWLFTYTSDPSIAYVSNTNSGVQTLSLYAKGNANNGLRMYSFGSLNCQAYFDLNTGSVENTNNIINAAIEDKGDGWYRCIMTFNQTNSNINFFLSNNANLNATSGNIYIQDVMLNQGLVAYPYVETTTAPVAGGILEDMPRIDYSSGKPSLLLEPSRTNLIPYSEYIEGLGGDVGLNFNYNDATSPEGLINAVQAVSSNTGQSYFGYFNGTAPAGDSAFSVFAKYDNCQYICLRVSFFTGGDDALVWFDIQNGTKGSSTSSSVTYDIEDYGNGWYRCYVIHNVDAGDISGTGRVYISDTDGGFISGLNQAAHFYGNQWEQGSYPTSYMPTYGTSQTRGMDTAQTTPADTIDTQSFTLFFEHKALGSTGTDWIYRLDISGTSDNISFYANSSVALNVYLGSANGGYIFGSANNDGFTIGSDSKVALSYDGNRLTYFINGSLYDSATGVSFNDANNKLIIRGVRNIINRQTIAFPTALSDDECIALTTI